MIYEDCRFSGIFGYGLATHLHFLRCVWTSGSNAYASKGSKAVLFESCKFIGTDTDPNHWGAVGSDGEAEFMQCSAQFFNLDGHAKLTLRDCNLQNVTCAPSARESGGIYGDVFIEKSKLLGNFNMMASTFNSFTIRDTVIDTLDLNGATVKSDILMERITGGGMNIGIREGANSFALKNSQIYGNGEIICSVYAGAFKTVLIEDCIFGGGLTSQAGIGGGFEPNDKMPQAVLTNNFTLRRNKVPSLRTGRLNAAHVIFEANTIDSLELIQSRIGKLEIQGNNFSRSVDFSGTQVGESKVQTLAKGQAKLDGSNIKLN